jgi:signal recognition particle GTPase
MSFEALQSEVRALPVAARRKLMAFMVALQDEGREGYAAKLAQKIDDQSPERWLSVEDCERKLGLADGSK